MFAAIKPVKFLSILLFPLHTNTGSLSKFDNRDMLVEYIEKNGGKVLKAVSSNVDYLINNDVTSNSSKNKKAKELGIKIISEDEFLELCKGDIE